MKRYDLQLSDWGPYNKEYLGVSRLADKERGVRFDFNLIPGFYRRSLLLPKDICDSGTKIMQSSADLSHFVLRYELTWKDRVYVDADFLTRDGKAMQVTCRVVNETEEPQSVMLHGCASVKFPTWYRRDLEVCEADQDTLWLDALDYIGIDTVQTLAQDGLKLGECRKSGAVSGSALSGEYFGAAGAVSYSVPEGAADTLWIRYQAEEDIALTFCAGEQNLMVTLPASRGWAEYPVAVPLESTAAFTLQLSKGAYLLDGFALGKEKPAFRYYTREYTPKLQEEDGSLRLDYAFGSYQIRWDGSDYEIREFMGRDIGAMLTNKLHNHTDRMLYGDGEGHFTDIFLRPIFLEPKSETTVTFTIEALYAKPHEVNPAFAEITVNSDGKPYALSQNIMTATTLTNTVFPIYCRGQYIRHNTPGRLWDSLYTWDSGFIGMGLNALSQRRGMDCLNTYLTDLGDIHSPFIFHGSVVPTQILLFQEIWNTTCDRGFLEEYYPYLEQYYGFFSGLCDEKTGLMKTWDIFYNSGGWDDYPPQKLVRDNHLNATVYPVITTAMTILCAKILKSMAQMLKKPYDQYDGDIARFSHAIQSLCWDEETGYFGYITTENGKPELLKYQGEINYNMGADGVYPYLADICTEEQEARILANIKEGLLTPVGVSVVDTRAPYYRTDGYWNGSVWMPHQWILWKSLLDKGEVALADEIAQTALKVWKNEVDVTYNCYEHFMVQNGRGAGFHQFGGLSTPVLLWYKAYYAPGTITGGFLTAFEKITWNEDYTYLECEIAETTPHGVVMVCMKEGADYGFTVNGEEVPATQLTNGGYVLPVKAGRLIGEKKSEQ